MLHYNNFVIQFHLQIEHLVKTKIKFENKYPRGCAGQCLVSYYIIRYVRHILRNYNMKVNLTMFSFFQRIVLHANGIFNPLFPFHVFDVSLMLIVCFTCNF